MKKQTLKTFKQFNRLSDTSKKNYLKKMQQKFNSSISRNQNKNYFNLIEPVTNLSIDKVSLRGIKPNDYNSMYAEIKQRIEDTPITKRKFNAVVKGLGLNGVGELNEIFTDSVVEELKQLRESDPSTYYYNNQTVQEKIDEYRANNDVPSNFKSLLYERLERVTNQQNKLKRYVNN